MSREKRNTLILGLALVLLLGGVWLYQRLRPSGPAVVAVVQLEGRELYRLDLRKETALTVNSLDGGHNDVVVRDGAVWVSDADCGDQTCVRTGKAWQDGQVIACLPHRMIIYVEEAQP